MQDHFVYTDTQGDDWHLNQKDVTLRNGHEQTIYFFTRDKRVETMCDKPEGFVVMETARTGMPVLKRA